MNTLNWLRYSGCVGIIVLGIAGSAVADERDGFSIGVGLGGMVAVDNESYLNKGSALYPELSVNYEYQALKASLSLGYINQQESGYWESGSDSYDGEYKLSFYPIELGVNFYPVKRFSSQDFPVQPYVGIGLGMLIASGDYEHNTMMISPRMGLDVIVGKNHVVGLDLSYHYMTGEESERVEGYLTGVDDGLLFYDNYRNFTIRQLDYFTVLLTYRFKFS